MYHSNYFKKSGKMIDVELHDIDNKNIIKHYLRLALAFDNPSSPNNKQNQPFIVWTTFTFLKLVLWYLPLAFVDISADFSVAYSLLVIPRKQIYGIVALLIDWLPGLVAFIDTFIAYRRKYHIIKVLAFCFSLLVFYPFMPTISIIYVLYQRNPYEIFST